MMIRLRDQWMVSSTAGTVDRWDVVGLALVGAAILSTFWSAAWSGGNPWPMAASYVLAAGAYVWGRAAGDRNRAMVPSTVVALGVVLAALTWGGAFGLGPDMGPLGYENARAAFFVQVAVAALMVAVAARPTGARFVAFAAAALFAVLPLVMGAGAASSAVVLLPVAAAATLLRRPVRLLVICSGVLALTAIAGTIVVATGGPRSRAGTVAGEALDRRRVLLWSDAFRLMMEHPLSGVGPGRFETESPTARSDLDAKWAHNGFLQQGAETGIVGFALLVLLFLWGFARLLPGDPLGVTVLGAFALAAIGILASLDYVLHFPAVTSTAAALVGTASAGTRSSIGSGR